MDFVFDKLVRRGINSASIDLGFNILTRLETKPEYNNDNSAYFEDILNRAATEPNADLKSRLIKGLRSLEPSRLTKDNKEFWQKVRQLPAA